MASNFDLSFADEEDVMLDHVEDEEDYSNREEYDRCYSPPSPTILQDIYFDDDESDHENPFIDDDEQLAAAVPDSSPTKYLWKIKAFVKKGNLAPDEVICLQSQIIKYFMVNFFSLFQPDKAFVEKHYKDLANQPFFAGLCAYMSSGLTVCPARVR